MSFIQLQLAQAMISNYMDLRQSILKTEYSSDLLPVCITVPKTEVTRLLGQSGSESLRIYLGADSTDNLITTILVAVDENGQDILDQNEPLIIDQGQRCPDNCPTGGLYP